ncbi:vWA domain-containing protein [Hylemonella gracilis]|nr:vWA domain-containing protein [Hylemonella gracilis]
MPNANIVLTLDCSDSMRQYSYFQPAQTDVGTFVNIMNTGDSLGMVGFSDNSWIFFPTSGASQMVAISGQPVQNQAVQAIQSQRTVNMTNMTAAIASAHGMLASSAVPRAIVLLSDGIWNDGGDPLNNLPTDIPIHTIALGPSSGTATLQQIATRTNAQYHYAPTAWDLADIYNSIVQTTGVASVAMNQPQQMQTYSFKQLSVPVTSGNAQAKFSLSWLNTGVTYTSGTPAGPQINISVRNPSGTLVTPSNVAVGPGFAVLTVPNPVAGNWQLGLWAGQTGILDSVAGGFEPSTSAQLKVTFETGDTVAFRTTVVHNGVPLRDIRVDAVCESPVVSVQEALKAYAAELASLAGPADLLADPVARLAILHRQKLGAVDILPRRQYPAVTSEISAGVHRGELLLATVRGSHTVRVTASGQLPDGSPFQRVARVSMTNEVA